MKTEKSKRLYHFEIILYILVVVVAMIIPFFIFPKETWSWNLLLKEWSHLLPFLAIFLANNFFLAPKLLLKERYLPYIISCIALLFVVVFINGLITPSSFSGHKKQAAPKLEMVDKYDKQPHPEEQNVGPKGEPPHNMGQKPPFMGPNKKPMPLRFHFGIFTIGLLIIGFNSGIKIFVRWMSEQDERDEKERQYLTTELAFLKHQVSPHFFMNTLNNIHALIDIDTEEAKDAIIKLSHLMRYLLYESDIDKVSLTREIEFMESYIELMRLRYDESNLSISITYSAHPENVYVPSLLFLPLIENAFKHGVDSRFKSFIDVRFCVNDDRLVFEIQNSMASKSQSAFNENSGIGLENIRKRLELIYKDNYTLSMQTSDNVFKVSLTIPIV